MTVKKPFAIAVKEYSPWPNGPLFVSINVNAMPHVLFIWNDESIEYLGQHGVTPEEFEEVVLNAKKIQYSRSSGLPIVFGPTNSGKFLACVFEYTGADKDEVLPVTAYEVDD